MRLPRLPARWSRIGHTRGRLILLAFVAAVPIAGMAATIAWQEFQSISRGAQERAALLDGQALAQFHTAVASVTGQLSASVARLSGNVCLGTSVSPAIGEHDVVGLVALDKDGRVTCLIGIGDLPAEGAPRGWFERVRGGQPFAVAVAGPAAMPILAVQAPNGGVVAAILHPSWLATAALPEPNGAGDVYWLLDDRRRVLASRGAAAVALPALPTMVRLIGKAQFATLAISADGVRYAYATSQLPNGWRLIAATPAAPEFRQAVRQIALRMAELAALMVVGFTAVILGADIAFGNPLRRLSAAVRRWQAGEPFEPGNLAGAPDEVGELAASFREATTVLREREAQLVQSQERQDLLLLEIHHRVKNNLQVVASLLNLQASRIRVPEARAEFQAARDRVRALATLHRHLYADGELHTINMRSFLFELCGQLFSAMGEREGDRIKLSIDAAELRLSSDQAVPLALIVTEAVTNAVKYAFPGGRSGEVSVSLTQRDGELNLVISDDGIGLPPAGGETESGRRDGLGLQLIKGFTRQLGGTLSVEQGPGTCYTVRVVPTKPVPMPVEALDV